MKVQNTELRSALAAQYVLGTLRGRARARLARLAANDAELRAELQFWESRLDRLATGIKPVTPPETVWIGLERRIEQGNTVALRSAAASTRAATPSSWRIVAGLATAAAVVLAVLLTQPKSGSDKSAPAAAVATNSPTALPPPEAAPAPVVAQEAPAAPVPPAASYVALLKMPKGDMQWTVSLTPAHGQMTVAVSGSAPRLRGHSPELWWLSPNGPVALGVLPAHGDGSMSLPAALAQATELKLAISIEPVGGSPTGKPTGPVVALAVAVKIA